MPTPTLMCRHCAQYKQAIGKKGLCWKCCQDPAIREQYPSESPSGRRGLPQPDLSLLDRPLAAEEARHAVVRERARGTRAFELFVSGQKMEILAYDAREFFGIDRMFAPDSAERIEEMRRATYDREDAASRLLGAAFDWIDGRFADEIRGAVNGKRKRAVVSSKPGRKFALMPEMV